MNVSAALYAIRWLVWDTFRQARASGIFWLMLGVSAVCILVCLSVRIEGSPSLQEVDGVRPEFLPPHDPAAADPARAKQAGLDVVQGQLSLGFGLVRLPLGRDARDAVRLLQMLLAGGIADAAGILLALIWTAGFLPNFLDPAAASVLLAKPVPRWSLLAGKYLGVLGFVAFQALLFVGGTWLALGISTGIWDAHYLACIPLLLLHFAIFFSCSALLAVCTRSTVACVVGSLLFWAICWGMNYGRHMVVGLAEVQALPVSMSWLVEVGYWTLPKPADLGILLFDALQADTHFGRNAAFQTIETTGAFSPVWSVVTSLLFTLGLIGVAGRQFVTTDY